MAFESLTEKLQGVFKQLRSKGRLTESDVREAMKEVKIALLEADVNFKAVKNFTRTVEQKAIGEDVMNGLNPGQMVIKIVHDELVNLMGSETTDIPLKAGGITVIMMAGLQACRENEKIRKAAAACGLRRLPPRRDQTAGDERRESRRDGFHDGRPEESG